jgi:hypothetical protein
MAGTVTLTRRDDLVVITVDNPPVNTITAAVRADLNAALDEIERGAKPRALLLRCAGKTFFSGADIGEFGGPPKEAEYRALWARFENQPVPVVVAMHGTVLGGGLELALACHYRFAAADARLGLPEVTLGIIPGAGGTQRLPRLLDSSMPSSMAICWKAHCSTRTICWPVAAGCGAPRSAGSIPPPVPRRSSRACARARSAISPIEWQASPQSRPCKRPNRCRLPRDWRSRNG